LRTVKLENETKSAEQQESWKTTVSWRTVKKLENNSKGGEE
jgi:hypothetical protein